MDTTGVSTTHLNSLRVNIATVLIVHVTLLLQTFITVWYNMIKQM